METKQIFQMALQELDIKRLTQIVFQLVEQVSCIECCKYYMAPETASCGHTLCHLCWKKRRTCPFCALPVNRQSVKLNLPLQDLTEHCHILCDSLETLFNIKLDDLTLIPSRELGSVNCPVKTVNEWLMGSQNHFSAPVNNSQSLSQEVQDTANQQFSTSKVQIHTYTEKKMSPVKVVHKSTPQDDWDKIEPIPEKYEIMTDKENIIGPMDIEPFNLHDKEYTTSNPRRSCRNKVFKKNITDLTAEENLANLPVSKDLSCDTDKVSYNVKQNWNNVKKMRKEFSKLNKKNKNKLNVSIEMCKQKQNSGNNVELPVSINKQICEIDDNTQNGGNSNMLDAIIDEQEINVDSNVNVGIIQDNISDINKPIPLSNTYTNKITNQAIDDDYLKEKDNMVFPEKELITSSRSSTSDLNNHDSRFKDNKIQFLKKGILCPTPEEHIPKLDTNNLYIDADSLPNTGDIDISIKIGNVLTNIFIKQKKSDVQMKVNVNREVQTSLEPHQIVQTNNNFVSNNMNVQNMQINIEGQNNQGSQLINGNQNNNEENKQVHSNKSYPMKKNTASTDTATAHFEITESVEKELSILMECENNNKYSLNNNKNSTKTLKPKQTVTHTPSSVAEGMVHNNDLDIFDSENDKRVKDLEYASSDILMPTIQTKLKTQKNADKREREINSGDDDEVEEQIPSKKIKVVNEKVNITADSNKSKNFEDPVNYDALMSKVFANIDADIDDIHQSQSNKDKSVYGSSSTKVVNVKHLIDSKVINPQNSKCKVTSFGNEEYETSVKDKTNEKYSENLFSMIEKDNDIRGSNNKVPPIEEILTPVACDIMEDSHEHSSQVTEGSDKCVVEDTPQKMQTSLKTKQKNTSNKDLDYQSKGLNTGDKISVSLEKKDTIISLNETLESTKSGKLNTVIDIVNKHGALETPLTINKFVNHITHKSTPVARKSLSFDNRSVSNNHEVEETLCPTAESVVRNTQEKEFMYKAFENTPEPVHKPLAMRSNDMLANKRLCVAGSCLNPDELRKLKYLCAELKWIYVDKYIKDVTHLVVAVDDQRKCQRSVKYMHAIAAGKWIVSFEWVKRCLIAKKYVDEAPFEAFDYTGEPSPKRSRITKRKLFRGITFFCMPPFSILNVDSLKCLLEDAGGVVVNEAKKVQVTNETNEPCLLLAEPENTQEDHFIYLALDMKIVPVNFEWALNCLGSYTLEPVQELLLCPSSILPKAILKWPALFSVDM